MCRAFGARVPAGRSDGTVAHDPGAHGVGETASLETPWPGYTSNYRASMEMRSETGGTPTNQIAGDTQRKRTFQWAIGTPSRRTARFLRRRPAVITNRGDTCD